MKFEYCRFFFKIIMNIDFILICLFNDLLLLQIKSFTPYNWILFSVKNALFTGNCLAFLNDKTFFISFCFCCSFFEFNVFRSSIWVYERANGGTPQAPIKLICVKHLCWEPAQQLSLQILDRKQRKTETEREMGKEGGKILE